MKSLLLWLMKSSAATLRTSLSLWLWRPLPPRWPRSIVPLLRPRGTRAGGASWWWSGLAWNKSSGPRRTSEFRDRDLQRHGSSRASCNCVDRRICRREREKRRLKKMKKLPSSPAQFMARQVLNRVRNRPGAFSCINFTFGVESREKQTTTKEERGKRRCYH